jgi:pyruvate kinase
MALMWGVYPYQSPYANSTEELMEVTESLALAKGLVSVGDVVVFVGNMPALDHGHTNFLKLHRIGQ